MNFRPLHDRVLVKRIESEEKKSQIRDYYSRHCQRKAHGRRSH